MTSRKAPVDAAGSIALVCFDVDGVLTDGRIVYTDDGRELKAFNVQDGAAIKLLREHGLEVAFITGRTSATVARRALELGVAHVYQGQARKEEALETILSEIGIRPAQAAHVGDDLPDLALFERVGLAVAVADAHPTVIEQADLVTKARGGEGVARELAEWLLRARGEWPY